MIAAFTVCMVAISSFSNTSIASPIDGPHIRYVSVNAREIKMYDFVAAPRTVTYITVNGDGDGDIDCLVKDLGTMQNIVSDNRKHDACIMKFCSHDGGIHRIFLVNNGKLLSEAKMTIW